MGRDVAGEDPIHEDLQPASKSNRGDLGAQQRGCQVEADLVVLATGMVPVAADGEAVRQLKDAEAIVAKNEAGAQLDMANETLEKLFHHDLLDKGSESTYTFKMDLWRRWIARMQSIWKVVREIADGDATKRESIGSLMPATAKTLTREQIADLLGYLFSLRGQ